MFSGTFYAQHSVTKNLHFSPRFSPTMFYQDANSILLLAHLYSSIIRLYPQNPLFKIVYDESVKVYPLMYSGNVQQNPLCVESCVTKEFSTSPLFSSTIFDPDANSVLLRAHLCTAVDSMRRKPCVRNCSRKREGLFNGKVQQNPLCAASCVTKDIHISPRFSPAFFLTRCKFCTPTSTSLYSGINTLNAQNPVFEIVHDESVKVYPHMYYRNFPCFLGCRQRFLIPMQIQCSYEDTFVQQ